MSLPRSVRTRSRPAVVGVVILFNPLAPVYLHRSTWRLVDIACAVAFIASLRIERTVSTLATPPSAT